MRRDPIRRLWWAERLDNGTFLLQQTRDGPMLWSPDRDAPPRPFDSPNQVVLRLARASPSGTRLAAGTARDRTPETARAKDLSTPKEPVQARSRDRVERILDAAEELVAESGTNGVTMQMISRTSGVGRASVYQFFPSILAVWRGLAV